MSKKYVSKELSEQIHKKADPFIKWLKEAEEETSEEDEDEVELEFDDRAKISALQVRLHTSSIYLKCTQFGLLRGDPSGWFTCWVDTDLVC